MSLKYSLSTFGYFMGGCLIPFILKFDKEQWIKLAHAYVLGLTILALNVLYQHAFVRGFTYDSSYDVGQPFLMHSHTNLSILLESGLFVVIGLLYFHKRSFWLLPIGALFIFLIFFSYSRASLVIGTFSYFLLWILIQRQFKIFLLSLLMIPISIAIITKVVYDQHHLINDERPKLYNTTIETGVFDIHNNISNADRMNRWLTGINMVKQHPITGVGPGTFPTVYEDYKVRGLINQEFKSLRKKKNMHNLYIAWLAEGGYFAFVLGLIIIYFLMRYLVTGLFQKNHAIHLFITCYLLSFWGHGMFQDFFNEPRVIIFFWVIVGAVLSLSTLPRNKVTE